MQVKIEAGWKEKLKDEFSSDYFAALTDFVREEYRTRQVFPPAGKIFNAFDLCPFDRVKVVIIGQDPYHNIGQAHGLCFSVTDGTEFPPSLVNIFRELNRDLGVEVPGYRKPGTVGRAGGSPAQCYPHSKGTSGSIAPEQGLGTVH